MKKAPLISVVIMIDGRDAKDAPQRQRLDEAPKSKGKSKGFWEWLG